MQADALRAEYTTALLDLAGDDREEAAGHMVDESYLADDKAGTSGDARYAAVMDGLEKSAVGHSSLHCGLASQTTDDAQQQFPCVCYG